MSEEFRNIRHYIVTLSRVASVTLNERVFPPSASMHPRTIMEKLETDEPLEIELFILTEDEAEHGYDEDAADLLKQVMENYEINIEKEIILKVKRVGQDELRDMRRPPRPE